MDARAPLFCDTALAARIERVETQLIAKSSQATRRRTDDAAGFAIAIAGGVASFAEAGSPFNKVAGLGFGVCRARPRWMRSSAPSRLVARRPRSSFLISPTPPSPPC
jgi:hypothetical protein